MITSLLKKRWLVFKKKAWKRKEAKAGICQFNSGLNAKLNGN
jgi:hypothetical protein